MSVYDELRSHKDIDMRKYDGVCCECLVTSAIDGDTVLIVCKLEDRFEKHCLRIHGIDTPEIHTRDADEKRRGEESKKALVDLIDKHRGEARVEFFKDEKYGRRLGKLFFGDVNVSEYMVEKQFAREFLTRKSAKPVPETKKTTK
jgi:endonuclease YncB( thermonuclease family)